MARRRITHFTHNPAIPTDRLSSFHFVGYDPGRFLILLSAHFSFLGNRRAPNHFRNRAPPSVQTIPSDQQTQPGISPERAPSGALIHHSFPHIIPICDRTACIGPFRPQIWCASGHVQTHPHWHGVCLVVVAFIILVPRYRAPEQPKTRTIGNKTLFLKSSGQ
jgi:hypothetical protein